MWVCPQCKHKFYNTNQSHSCGQYSIDGFLQGRTEHSIRLFGLFLDKYRQIGPYELHPVKTRVALLTKMRFASINKLATDHLDGHLVLTEAYDDQIFYKIDNLNERFFVHHFRIYNSGDLNKNFQKYMALAYKIGQREHVTKSGRQEK